MTLRQRLGLFLGPALFLLLLLMPVPEGMPPEAMRVAAVTALMATWWIMEAVPIAATALLPIALFPLLEVMPASQVTPAYANHIIYLFMGGFLIAMAIEKWSLHRRIALHTIRIVGTSPQRVIFGFMFATAFLSSWISNTATAMMMVTIGMAVLTQMSGVNPAQNEDERAHTDFGTALMLGIAYAASIGGVATLIGTPPNAILAGVLERQYGYSIGFAEWMLFGLPVSLLMLLVTWLYLTRIAFRHHMDSAGGSGRAIEHELEALGPMSRQERRVLVVFALVVFAWVARGFIDVPELAMVADSTIAMLGAMALFVIPADWKRGQMLLDWATAARIPWDIIILFGGGFALASAFASSGLTEWIGGQLTVLQGAGLVITVMAVAALVIFLTEVTSNTATASLLLPVMTGFAVATDTHPLFLMVAVALSASFAFMLPVATPPNAIVFSSRQVTIPQMAHAGVWLNLIAIVLVTAAIVLFLPVIMDTVTSLVDRTATTP
ncbi:MAG TPA: DASS family sodium-coupled anion symporter [Thioalkalivibrio sp.]|nr:DASS family sodium-coupled anion symporter [Thioalkalivibrio sp.]